MTELLDLSDPAYRLLDVLMGQPRSRISKVGVTDLFAEKLAAECGRHWTAEKVIVTLAELRGEITALSGTEHFIEFRPDGSWVIEHPSSCRANGPLTDCPYNDAGDGPAFRQGRYVATLDGGCILLTEVQHG